MAAVSFAGFKPLTMADSVCNRFLPQIPDPSRIIPSKPNFLLLSISMRVPLKAKLLPSRRPLIALVAQTSDWARQDEESEVAEAGLDWEGADSEARASDWEAEGEDDVGELSESVAEEGEGTGEDAFEDTEDSYQVPPEEAKLFVGNIPYDMESADLAELFNKAGVVETAEVVYNRETDQSRGFGFVAMSSIEEAERAIEMFNRYDINGRVLTVNKAAPRGTRVERPARSFGPAYRLYVGNIPWQVDNARLEQLFSEHGKVVDARIVFDKGSGRSRGFGFVTMSSQSEMDDAIEALDGYSFDGRIIRVSVAQERPRRDSF